MKNNPYKSLMPLFEMKSGVDKIEDFHAGINVIFHDVESKYYDTIHKEMWKNLQEQFNKLVNSIDLDTKTPSIELSLLDIGCGTGLSTEMLLKTSLGSKIKTIHLLDTSAQMLEKAKKRIQRFKKPIGFFNTEIENVEQTFDVIVICSVVHHIPDLNSFFYTVEKKLNPGGILITMHDPYAEAIKSATFKNRVSEYNAVEHRHRSFLPRKIVNKFSRKFKSFLQAKDPINEVNELLLKNGITKMPLSHAEIWSVTDIHVEDLPYSNQNGVSLTVLKAILHQLSLKNLITYCFYGSLKSNITKAYQLKEDLLIENKDQFGRNFGTLWIKE